MSRKYPVIWGSQTLSLCGHACAPLSLVGNTYLWSCVAHRRGNLPCFRHTEFCAQPWIQPNHGMKGSPISRRTTIAV